MHESILCRLWLLRCKVSFIVQVYRMSVLWWCRVAWNSLVHTGESLEVGNKGGPHGQSKSVMQNTSVYMETYNCAIFLACANLVLLVKTSIYQCKKMTSKSAKFYSIVFQNVPNTVKFCVDDERACILEIVCGNTRNLLCVQKCTCFSTYQPI